MPGESAEKTKSFCAILGLNENFTVRELRDAYHEKASRLHPDLNPDDSLAAEAFKKVNIAYEYLKKQARASGKKPQKEQSKKLTSAPPPAKRVAPSLRSVSTSLTGVSMEELVLRLRHSENKYVRLHAVKGLENFGGKETIWILVRALEDPEPAVVAEAIRSLGALKARISVMPLIHKFKVANPAMRLQIEQALEGIDTPLAKKFLSKLRPSETENSMEKAN